MLCCTVCTLLKRDNQEKKTKKKNCWNIMYAFVLLIAGRWKKRVYCHFQNLGDIIAWFVAPISCKMDPFVSFHALYVQCWVFNSKESSLRMRNARNGIVPMDVRDIIQNISLNKFAMRYVLICSYCCTAVQKSKCKGMDEFIIVTSIMPRWVLHRRSDLKVQERDLFIIVVTVINPTWNRQWTVEKIWSSVGGLT